MRRDTNFNEIDLLLIPYTVSSYILWTTPGHNGQWADFFFLFLTPQQALPQWVALTLMGNVVVLDI